MDVTMLNFKTRLIFIIGVFILLQCNECASKRTVVFMLDKEVTTADEIKWLSENIQKASAQLRIEGMDFEFKLSLPYHCCAKKNSNIYLQQTIQEISEKSKTDSDIRAQSTLKSLLSLLQDFPSYSTIFVITNVTTPSNNASLLHDIFEQIQIKRTQVNFIIGAGFCSAATCLREYKAITALSSNGFVMGPDVLESEFAGSIYMRLRYVPQEVRVLNFQDSESGTSLTPSVPFVDARIDEMLHSAVDLNEHEKYPEKPYRTTLMNAMQSDDGVWHFVVTEPTQPCPTCDGKSRHSNNISTACMNGFDRDDFNFEYGFSASTEVRSLNETFRRPIKGSNNIYVSTNDEIWQYGFTRFRILFLNGSSYRSSFGEKMSLYLIPDTDLFWGSFEAPDNEYFFIEVTTIIDDTATVFRTSTTAMRTVDKFGDDRNPAFEYNPAYKGKPVSFKWAEYSKHAVECELEDSQDTTTNSSISFYDIVNWIFSAAFLGVVIPCIPYFLFKIAEFSRLKFHACCERVRKILQRLKSKKTDNQSVPDVDNTVADRKASE